MRVRMLTTMAGPDVNHNAGSIVDDFPDDIASQLIDGGYAIEVDERGNQVGGPKDEPLTLAETAELDMRRRAVEDEIRGRKAAAAESVAQLQVPRPKPPAQGAMHENAEAEPPPRPATAKLARDPSNKNIPAQPSLPTQAPSQGTVIKGR